MKKSFLQRVLWLMIPLLTMFTTNVWGATTYKLTQVTAASGLNTTDKYVFEQGGYVMNNSINSSALQTTSTFSTTGLSGSETYIWKLASATTGYKMQCLGKTGNNYLANSSSTSVSFATTGNASDWSITFTDGIAKITNNSNSGRFLGWTSTTSHVYKAYATNNSCDTYPCSIIVYKLEEESSCTTNPSVSAASNSSVTSTTARVTCSGGITSLGSAGCSISSYGFVIGPSANPRINGDGVTQHEVGTTYTTVNTSFYKDLTGLTAGTTYHVCPYATNGNGTEYGTETSFTTTALPNYTVTFNAGSGTCGTSQFTQTAGTRTVSLPTASPSAACASDGWTFAGWCTSTAGSSASNTSSPGTILTASTSYEPTSTHTLYAVYTKSGGGGSAAAANTVMLAEPFTDFNNNNCPSAPGATSATVYDSGIEYVCNPNNTSSGTRIQTGSGPSGGSEGNNIIVKSGGYFQINNIPTGGAATLTFTCRVGGSNTLTISSQTADAVLGSNTGTSAARTYTITINNDAETFDLRFAASGGNMRLDDIEIKVATAGSGGSTTYYMTNLTCAACTPITPTVTYSATTLTAGGSTATVSSTSGNTGSATPSYAVTTSSPEGCITVDPSTGAVTPLSAGTGTVTITFPAISTYCSGTTTVDFTVNAALYTVTYNAGSGSCGTSNWTQTFAGESTTLPTASPSVGCAADDWEFAGWCMSGAGDDDDNTSSPGTILTGSYTPTSNITLYAIYKKVEGSGGDGFTLSLVTDKSGSDVEYYIAPRSGSDAFFGSTTTAAEAETFYIEDDYLYIYESATKTYVGGYGNNTTTYFTTSSPTSEYGWTITESSDVWTFRSKGTGTRDLAFNYNSGNPRFSTYTGGSTYPYQFTKHSAGTTYYMTSLTCSLPTNFANGSTFFIQAESSSAWDANACVKAWFHTYGGSEAAQPTYWLFDATGDDNGKKLFATIVPATGDLPYLDIQRFPSNCEGDMWNKNGGVSRSESLSNTVRSTAASDDHVFWNATGVTMELWGAPDSWTASLASVTDQSNGIWSGTYNNYTPAATSAEFKIKTNYNGWIGNTGSNNNATLSGMIVGSTYNATATLDIKDHSLVMSKEFVKGTVHFDKNGHGGAGTIADLTNVLAGATITAPSDPEDDTYVFQGWFKEPGCVNAWDFENDVMEETMTLYAKWGEAKVYTLLTDAANLYDGDEIVIIDEEGGHAMSTTQNANNRGATSSGFSITGSNLKVTGDGIQAIFLEKASNTPTWKMNVGTDAYLYAASSSANQLKTGTSATAGDNGVWTISVSSNIATITAQGDYTHNLMQYNTGSTLFSCYTSAQKGIKIYHTPITEPTIITTGTLSEFTYVRGNGPSATQTFVVRGVLLTGNLTVTAPTNYQVSLDGENWASSKTITASGTLSATTVYVRLAAGLAANTYNGNITISGGSATDKTIAVTGSVTVVCTTPEMSFAAPIVTKVSSSSNTTFTNELTVTGNDRNAAITFTSSDPTKATVTNAGLVTVLANQATADGTPVVITATIAEATDDGTSCQNGASLAYNLVIGHKVTWYVNGTEYTEGNPTTIVASGGSIEALPTAPDGEIICGNKVFVGWTAIPGYNNASTAPGDLFTAPSGAPAINANKDFYAVFADASSVSSTVFKRAHSADDITFAVGQKIVIVDNENSKILNSSFSNANAPAESNGKITVSSSQIWTLTEQDDSNYWILKCGNIQLGVNEDEGITSGYSYCGNYNTYASAWVIEHSSAYDESVEDCFYLFNWINEDGSEDENEGGYGEFYNALRFYASSTNKWEVQYTDEISSSNKAHFAMKIYVPDVTYTNYNVTCISPHLVTVSSGGHGTVTADPIYVVDGGSTTLTLTPNEGYECSSVRKNSGSATEGTLSNCSYTLTNITSDVDLTAIFTKAPTYSVIFDAGDGKIVGQNTNSVTLTETTRTYGVKVPRATSCADDWTFAYWSTANPTSESNTTAPAHTADANQTYVPSADNEHLYAIYIKTSGTPVPAYGTDEITRTTTGVPDQTGTTVTYQDWSAVSATNSGHTSAVYAGNSAGGHGVMQMRDKNPSGIVSTTSGGTVNEVKIYWDSNTSTSGRSVEIWGYNSAYASGADLYGGTGTSAKGTKLGTVTYDSGSPTNTFTVTGSYAYVGLRPKGGAMYWSQVDIKWITSVSGLTTYYCHTPTCDDCTDATFGFEKSEATITHPHAGTYVNTFTTNNTSTKTFTSSNTNVATVENASTGALTIVGPGTTTISVHQDRMTTGTTKYCAVDAEYTLIVKGASVDVVEVNNNNQIIIEHDLGGNTNALIDQLILHEEGNKAEEVFISKYFEATGSVKLVALYNGTGKAYDPSKYRIRCASGSASAQHIVKVGDYVDEWPNGKELIFYSWDTNNESDGNVMDCVYDKNENGDIDMSEWIPVPWSNYSANKPGIIFGGSDAVVLEEYDGSQWNILDILGALSADGKTADKTNLVNTSTITWGDGSNKGWYCATGRELGGDDETNYALSTLRCLLVRKFDVLSGKAARNTTTGNLGTGQFNTLCTEWYGKQVSKTNAETSTCNSFSEVGNFDYYNSYQKYEPMETGFEATPNGDGTMTITITADGGLAALSCNYLKIKVTNADQSKELAEVEYKVPIIVSAENTQTDNTTLFKYDDCSICDVAILQNASLKAVDGGENTLSDLEVYSGGKLVVPTSKEMNINSLTMRSKGDVVPKADIQGTLNRLNTTLNFDKRIPGDRWYFFALPYDCEVSDITFRNGIDAVNGVDYLIQYYDGAERAAQGTASFSGSAHWKPFEGSTLLAGQGYIIAVEPKSGHTNAELRFPMKDPNLAKTSTGVAVRAWGGDKDDDELKPNHKGWNLIGNPFLNTYKKNVLGEPLQLGTLEEGDDGYELVTSPASKNIRFVYVPQRGGWDNYTTVAVSLQDLEPFFAYFAQIAGNPEDNLGVSFTRTNVEVAPSSIVRRSPKEVADDEPIWVILDMIDSQQAKDETTILISDQFTDGYDLMDDGLKWRGDYYTSYGSPLIASRNNDGEMAFNALPDASAEAGIPLNYYAPKNGNYTFALNGVMGMDNLKEVQLFDASDGQYYDLLAGDQVFNLKKGNNTSRFTLFVKVDRNKPLIPTDIDDVTTDGSLSLIAINKTLVLSGLTNDANVYLYDMSGKLLRGERANGNTGVWRATVPTTGVYFVRVNSAAGQQTLRTIVK